VRAVVRHEDNENILRLLRKLMLTNKNMTGKHVYENMNIRLEKKN